MAASSLASWTSEERAFCAACCVRRLCGWGGGGGGGGGSSSSAGLVGTAVRSSYGRGCGLKWKAWSCCERIRRCDGWVVGGGGEGARYTVWEYERKR